MIDTDKLVDGIPFEFECPECGNKIKKLLGWFKKNKRVTCGKCSAVVLVDEKRVARTRRDLAKANADLAKTVKQLRRFGK